MARGYNKRDHGWIISSTPPPVDSANGSSSDKRMRRLDVTPFPLDRPIHVSSQVTMLSLCVNRNLRDASLRSKIQNYYKEILLSDILEQVDVIHWKLLHVKQSDIQLQAIVQELTGYLKCYSDNVPFMFTMMVLLAGLKGQARLESMRKELVLSFVASFLCITQANEYKLGAHFVTFVSKSLDDFNDLRRRQVCSNWNARFLSRLLCLDAAEVLLRMANDMKSYTSIRPSEKEEGELAQNSIYCLTYEVITFLMQCIDEDGLLRRQHHSLLAQLTLARRALTAEIDDIDNDLAFQVAEKEEAEGYFDYNDGNNDDHENKYCREAPGTTISKRRVERKAIISTRHAVL
ncbi:hypothetical protein MPSEU_000766700 [Mayamaea pseudoterrestris]|nr:hypothetical protein MPSEU_000766700 [Mayamaea pseudoterrestris]